MAWHRVAIPRAPGILMLYVLLVAGLAWYVWSAPFGPGQNGIPVNNAEWVARALILPIPGLLVLILLVRRRRR